MEKINPLKEIQSFLSIGYIYLVVMGILHETISFNQIGVNYLKYSSIMDVLISPIAIITSSIPRLVVFSTLILIAFNLPKYMVKNKEKDWVKKSIKFENNVSTNDMKTAFTFYFFYLFALGLFGFFIGTGMGNGWGMAKEIKAEEIEYNDKLSFINGDVEEVEILGTNSAYIFYVTNESKTVKITPISGVVKSIDEIQ